MKPTILVTEDNPEVWEYLDVVVRSLGYSTEHVEDAEETVARLARNPAQYALLLVELGLRRKNAMKTVQQVRQLDSRLPIILFPGASSPQSDSSAMQLGPNDLLIQSIGHDELQRAIRKALSMRSEGRTPDPAGASDSRGGPKVASSRWIQKLDLFLKQVGGSEVPVLLQGETGVGKEVLARGIHAASRRADKPFLKINCASLPSELVESELFGYERGAFTGAFRSSPGKFEMADGGTILLDEIGDMDFKLQAKLLQVLQDGEFLRLGSKDTCRVNVRVIAATHCDLEWAISENRFREDLYYRLNVIRIDVPALRERRDEILPLAQHFIEKYAAPGDERVEIGPALKQVLLEHNWPGNVRELENVIRKLLVLRSPEIVAEDLQRAAANSRFFATQSRGDQRRAAARPSAEPAWMAQSTFDGANQPFGPAGYRERPLSTSPKVVEGVPEVPARPSILRKVDEARKQAEIEAIMTALNTTLWNRKEAAAMLNIEYKALLYKMKRLGIGERVLSARVE